MAGRTIFMVLVAFAGACDGPSSVQPRRHENFQLPDASEWITAGTDEAGEDLFVAFGVRDPTAPNMLLNRWLSPAPPNPDRSALHPETARALREDTALIIDLHDVPLTEGLRSQLASLTKVQWLRLSAGVTASDLRWLGRMKQLRGLSLTCTELNHADFRQLDGASLQYLTLGSSDFTESDFRTFPRLAKLETLWLDGKCVTDACLQRLTELRLPSLRTLGLHATLVTDDSMRELCRAYDLEYLDVFNSQGVTQRSVESIAVMKNLQLLGVGGSGIAPGYQQTLAVDELRRLLPNCRVDYYD